jgi:hypothetical protein
MRYATRIVSRVSAEVRVGSAVTRYYSVYSDLVFFSTFLTYRDSTLKVVMIVSSHPTLRYIIHIYLHISHLTLHHLII